MMLSDKFICHILRHQIFQQRNPTCQVMTFVHIPTGRLVNGVVIVIYIFTKLSILDSHVLNGLIILILIPLWRLGSGLIILIWIPM